MCNPDPVAKKRCQNVVNKRLKFAQNKEINVYKKKEVKKGSWGFNVNRKGSVIFAIII